MDTITLKKGLLTNFFEGFNGAAAQWDQVATKVPSTAASEDYGWLGSVPRLREMKGERVPQKLLDYTYTLKNKEFEASIEVRRSDLKDDQTGKFGPLVQSIGESAKVYPDELVFGALLPNGFTSLCYDGQYFFDTDHPVGNTGGVQSNKMTTALAAASFQTARSMLFKMQDDFGRPMSAANMKLLLVIPTELQGTAEGILNATVLASGASNTLYKAADILVSPWLTDADNWYLLNVGGVVKPFVVQEREFIPFESLEEGSETAWWNKIYYYGTYWRGNAGYGLYQKAVGSLV
jgi:phage major head subunit gpT-like protein